MAKYIRKTYEPIKDLEGEIWKDIPEFEGRYQASNLGRICSLNYRGTHCRVLLKTRIDKKGYESVALYNKYGKYYFYRVHRLVYSAFYGIIPKYNCHENRETRMEINHIDENKTNNKLENLELITGKQNYEYGTGKVRCTIKNRENVKKLRKKVYQYSLDGKLIKIWESVLDCHRHKFYHRYVNECCANKHKKTRNVYKGCIWSNVPLENTTK